MPTPIDSGYPLLTDATHQSDLWTVHEARAEFGAWTPIDSTERYMSQSTAKMGGGSFDEAYLSDLEAIQEGMRYQVKFHIANQHLTGLTDFLGEATPLTEIGDIISQKAEEKRSSINAAIGRAGVTLLRITNFDTYHLDGQRWHASVGQEKLPEEDSWLWSHQGERVGKLVVCEAMKDDKYFTFIVEGKSGSRYSYIPHQDLQSILINPSRSVLKPPRLPIEHPQTVEA